MEVEKEESSKVRMNFWLTAEMYGFVEAVAARDGRSMSDVLRVAIREFIVRESERDRQLKGDADGRG